MTKKEKILASCNSIPTASLVNYLNDGEVTLAELRDAGLTSEKNEDIQNHIAANEQVMWKSAQKKDTPQSYFEFLRLFPDGTFTEQCKSCLSEKEEEWWSDIKLAPTVESINEYLAVFPLGRYVTDANNLLQDMPWLETCKIGTEVAYIEYKNTYPENHSAEIKSILNGFRDESDWSLASRQNTTEAYQNYLHQHRYGKHAKNAQKIIDERSLHDNILNGLKANKNAFSAEDILKAVEEKTVTEHEICDILGDKWVAEIMNYSRPADLPIYNSVPELEKGRTEVYFWGTPASGKTCTLGAVLSRAESKGLLRKRGGAIMYLDALKNIFKKNGINRLPNSTSNTCIYNMGVDLKDSEGRSHAITMIDIAGEIFKCIYYDSLGQLNEDDDRKRILDTTFNYLKDKRNKKIMFFVVEYNGHDRVWDDNTSLTMSDYLNRCAILPVFKQVPSFS